MMNKLFMIDIKHQDVDYETHPYNECIKSNYNFLRDSVTNEEELNNYLTNFVLYVRQ